MLLRPQGRDVEAGLAEHFRNGAKGVLKPAKAKVSEKPEKEGKPGLGRDGNGVVDSADELEMEEIGRRRAK